MGGAGRGQARLEVGGIGLDPIERHLTVDRRAVAGPFVDLLDVGAREQPFRRALHVEGTELVRLPGRDDRAAEPRLRRLQTHEGESLLRDPGPSAQRGPARIVGLEADDVAGAPRLLFLALEAIAVGVAERDGERRRRDALRLHEGQARHAVAAHRDGHAVEAQVALLDLGQRSAAIQDGVGGDGHGGGQARYLEGQHARAGGDQGAHTRGLPGRRGLMSGHDLGHGQRARRRHFDPCGESRFSARPSGEAKDEGAAKSARVDLRVAGAGDERQWLLASV